MSPSSTASVESLFELAKTVIDPELGQNIVDLGMLTSITISDAGEVNARVALTTVSCPLRGQITDDLRRHLARAPGVESVEIEISTMDPAAKANLMAIARKSAQVQDNTSIPLQTKIIAIASGKGGVGKSTVTALLARAMAARGLKIGLLDADIWGFSIPAMFDIKDARLEASGTSSTWSISPYIAKFGEGEIRIVSMGMLTDNDEGAIMWRGLMLSRAVQHFLEDVDWSGIDYLLIDMPPGTGDVAMALARLAPRTEVVVVTTPSTAAAKVASRMGDMARKGHLRLVGVIENMSYFDCGHGEIFNLFGTGGGEELAAGLGIPLIMKLPLTPPNRAESGSIVTGSTTSVSESFADLAERICTDYAPLISMTGCSTRMVSAIEELLGK